MGLTLANKITIGRIIIVPLFISTLLNYTQEREDLRIAATLLFLVAVISDVIDGYVARRYYQKTPAGAVLDPLADKLLLISAFVCLSIVGHDLPVFHFPIWIVVTLISRDIVLLIGALIILSMTGKLTIEANRWGKLTAFLQVMIILGMLFQIESSQLLWPFAVVATIISGIIYTREGIKALNESST